MLSGAFAEVVAVPELACVKLPDTVSFEIGAATLLTYATTLHALADRASLAKGESLLVLGAAGGVGIAAVELGALMGARVIAAASTDEKLAFCREHGATDVINYATDDLKTRLKGLIAGGVDVVYDPVGGSLAEAALRSTAWQGRYLVVGFASGDIPKIPLNLVLLKGCQIVGVFWGQFVMREPQKNRAHATRSSAGSPRASCVRRSTPYCRSARRARLSRESTDEKLKASSFSSRNRIARDAWSARARDARRLRLLVVVR
jgi:NADPH2:quinone reductase